MKKLKVYLIGDDPIQMKEVEKSLIKDYEVINHFNFKELFEGEYELNPLIKNKMRFIELLSSDFICKANVLIDDVICSDEFNLAQLSGIKRLEND